MSILLYCQDISQPLSLLKSLLCYLRIQHYHSIFSSHVSSRNIGHGVSTTALRTLHCQAVLCARKHWHVQEVAHHAWPGSKHQRRPQARTTSRANEGNAGCKQHMCVFMAQCMTARSGSVLARRLILLQYLNQHRNFSHSTHLGSDGLNLAGVQVAHHEMAQRTAQCQPHCKPLHCASQKSVNVVHHCVRGLRPSRRTAAVKPIEQYTQPIHDCRKVLQVEAPQNVPSTLPSVGVAFSCNLHRASSWFASLFAKGNERQPEEIDNFRGQPGSIA